MSRLDCLFRPKSIALVGAAHTTEKLGGVILKNLLRFKGRLYPVNPKYSELMGKKAYASFREIPEAVDLSLIIRPAEEIPRILKEHKDRAGCAVILSSGFAEAGRDALQAEIKEIGKDIGIRILGPNCMGVYNPYEGLDTFFLPHERLKRPKKGNAAVVSQSGAIISCLLGALRDSNIGVSKAVGYGNAVDIDEAEIYEYLAYDEDTGVVLSYIESINDGRRFIEKAKILAERKPLLILKSGKSESGGSAAFSHTGRLAGRYEVFHSALKQFGINEAGDFDELIDSLKALSYQKTSVKGGRRILIITNGGGSGVLAADECCRQGLDVTPLKEDKIKRLKEIFPGFYGIGNPIDLTAQVRDEDYATALNELKDDYDGFVVIALPNVLGITERLAGLMKTAKEGINKPVVFHIAKSNISKRLTALLEKAKMPVYPSPERAVRAVRALLGEAIKVQSTVRTGKAGGMIKDFLEKHKGKAVLLEHEVKGLLRGMGLPTPEGVFIVKGSPMPDIDLKYPIVAKVSSTKIASKSDVNGIRLGIKNHIELKISVRELLGIKDAEGVLLEEMAPEGLEVVIGGIIDRQFGPVVMFGLGGVFVELFKDVAFCLAPVKKEDALWLIKQVKGWSLLEGYRTSPTADINTLLDIIVSVSKIISTGLIKEIDLNPVRVYPKGALILDAKVAMPAV